MSEEWLEIACINHEKYIVHGQLAKKSPLMVRQVEQTLTPEQKKEVDEFLRKQDHELFLLLKGIVNG